MKSKFRNTILLIFLSLLGITLLFYPVISNILYDLRQDGVILEYQNKMQKLNESDPAVSEALSLAEEYNKRLATGIVNLSDPNTFDGDLLFRNTITEMTNITGSGIIGIVDVPSINVSLPIFCSTQDSDLEHGVGVLEYTSLPVGGESTHSVLCAHSGLSSARLFSDLPNVTEGDIFFIHVLGMDLAYQVDQIRQVEPEDVSLIGITTGADYCTLLTCVPYGINSHRLLVRGTRVEYREDMQISQEMTEKSVKNESVWLTEYLYSIKVGAAIVLVLFFIWFIISRIRRSRKHGKKN